MITLATLPKATAKQVFDQISEHMLKQNEKSLEPESNIICRYRGERGLKCAAGCLFADDEYNQEYEGRSWLWLAANKLAPIPSSHVELISSLQKIHDGYDPSSWKNALQRIAIEQGF